MASGPSPRGWGIPLAETVVRSVDRTIPTRVGNTVILPHARSRVSDHPHAGGEYISTRYCETRQYGPSPRGWGIRHRNNKQATKPRPIPTRVGNTVPRTLQTMTQADHPHAGGEYHTRC